ncbi:unnamed protein product [Peniophora sp. CBMAI 1063]|nr:unnamed protein product [Peniophora sp. CBMAI 1063]
MANPDADMDDIPGEPVLAKDSPHTWAKVTDLALRHMARVPRPPTHPEDASLEDRVHSSGETMAGHMQQLVNSNAHIPASVRVPKTWMLIDIDMNRISAPLTRRPSDFYVGGSLAWTCPKHDCVYTIFLEDLSPDQRKLVKDATRGVKIWFFQTENDVAAAVPEFFREVIDIVALAHYESAHFAGLLIHHVIHGQDAQGRILYHWQLNNMSTEFKKKTVRGWEARRYEEICRVNVQRGLAQDARNMADSLIRTAKEGDKSARERARARAGYQIREEYRVLLDLKRPQGLFDARASLYEGRPENNRIVYGPISAMKRVHATAFEAGNRTEEALAERDALRATADALKAYWKDGEGAKRLVRRENTYQMPALASLLRCRRLVQRGISVSSREMSQQSSGRRKPLAIPSTRWRAPAGQRGYLEDRLSKLAVTRDISTSNNGQNSTRTGAVHVPQTSLGILERTLKAKVPEPLVPPPPEQRHGDGRSDDGGLNVESTAKASPSKPKKVWLYGEWIPVSLRQLGLTVQFGHWAGERCSLQRHVSDRFVVVHTNGIHEVRVAFCGCSRTKVHRRDQLLAARWYPATTEKPKTAATLEVLEQFDAHSAAGKDNAYDFYNALEHLTDGAGIFHLPDRSKDFLRMAHEHRHLLALKRGGRGHDPSGGVERTQHGELAVLCPACPHKGINTEGVVEFLKRFAPELAEDHATFNDTVHLAMDCNFRAKNRMTRSTQETSPYLGDGMAYMVPEASYEEYTKNSAYDTELSSCSRFGATILANLKNGKGLRTTGIGAVFCARHEFFWPNAIGTLIKGERYCTMDYILAAALRRLRASSLRLYYDIVCQYTRNLNLRMLEVERKSFIYAGAQKLLHQIHVTFGIPKFHNPGHLVMCQLYFNLSYIKGTGNTDGEASERAWAGLNPAASSLREMGPGTMRDTIDFFCSAWNWRKFVNMSESLCRKMDLALAMALEHCELFTALLGAVRRENSQTADVWLGEGEEYDARDALDEFGRPITSDADVKNPFESRTKKQSLERARLQSASIAAATQAATQSTDADKGAKNKTTALTNFIVRAFKVEILQRRASVTPADARTYIQKRERIEQVSDLDRQVRLFRKDQQWIMPSVYAAIQELEGVDAARSTMREDDGADGDESEQHNAQPRSLLYLPSDLDQPLARTMLDVLMEELRLRYAAMEDWLDVLRQQLRVRGTVRQWKVSFTTGQRMATRTINKQRVIQENVDQARDMYRWHRERYAKLASFLTDDERKEFVPALWEDLFEPLADEDCRPLNNSLLIAIESAEVQYVKKLIASRRDGVATGQSGYTIPWIWYKVSEGTEMELNDDLRVEFMRCRARAMRWVEEVYQLAYEMVRVPFFCSSRSVWWQDRAAIVRPDLDAVTQDGVRSYAKGQASMFRRHARGFEERFAGPLKKAAEFARLHGLDGLIRSVVRETVVSEKN